MSPAAGRERRVLSRIRIHAPWRRVFDAAAAVERWPLMMKPYEKAKVLVQDDGHRMVDVRAKHGGVPWHWVSRQDLEPQARKMHFHHTRSFLSRGMDAQWYFSAQSPEETEVIVTHSLPWRGGLRGLLDQWLLGPGMVQSVADETLAGLKVQVEAG